MSDKSWHRQIWDEVQDRVENSIILEGMPQSEMEDELDKRMIILIEKICDLAFKED